jgi:hypothetical protein
MLQKEIVLKHFVICHFSRSNVGTKSNDIMSCMLILQASEHFEPGTGQREVLSARHSLHEEGTAADAVFFTF